MKALAQPVGKSLHFAGEATSVNYPATVHGAWLSGVREAKMIYVSVPCRAVFLCRSVLCAMPPGVFMLSVVLLL